LSKQFNRKAFIQDWLVNCVVIAALTTPMTWATGLLLVIVGAVVPVVAVLLWKVPPPTIAEVLNRVERSTTRF
jgi:ABC-type transport system involved in cytochrome bd biosynthesis fused ATPase/permease subunit